MSPFLQKAIAGTLAAATLSLTLAASSTPAEAFHRGWGGRDYGWDRWGGGWGRGVPPAYPYYGYGYTYDYGYGYPGPYGYPDFYGYAGYYGHPGCCGYPTYYAYPLD